MYWLTKHTNKECAVKLHNIATFYTSYVAENKHSTNWCVTATYMYMYVRMVVLNVVMLCNVTAHSMFVYFVSQ